MRKRAITGLLAYALAVAVVAMAVLIRLAFDPLLGGRQPFAAFYAAVAITAWLGGLGPALLALGLGYACADYFFIWPFQRIGFADAGDALMAAIYFFVGIIIAASNHAMRRAQRQADESAGAVAARRVALRESEGRLGAIIASATDAIVTVDARHRIALFNAAAERMFKCPASEAIGQLLDPFIPPGSRARHPEYIDAFAATAVSSRAMGGERVLRAVRADGEEFPMEAQISQATIDGQKLFTVVMRDVSERKRAEAEREDLLRREREARERAETATQLLARVQAIADAALAGRSLDDVLGELLARIRSVLGADTAVILLREADVLRVRAAAGLDEEAQRQVRVPIGQGFAGRIAAERHPIVIDDVEPGTVVSRYIRETGIHSLAGVPLELRGMVSGVLHIGSKRPRRFTDDEVQVLQLAGVRIALAIDRAAAHDAEHAAREAAEAASQAKDEFLSVVSHELRTPLAAITNWVRVLRTGKSPFADRAIDSIDRSARAQAKLIEDLLDVSRIVSGRMRLDPRAVDVPGVIRDALDMIRPTADAKGIRIESTLAMAPTVVAGDPERLQQIVWNLSQNAVKFTPAGGKVEVRLEQADHEVRIIVRDTGRGISPEFLPHVFERFRQADRAATRRHGGLGIGLAIVRHLVELHGGTVAVESAGEDQGATFTVALPLLAEPAALTGNGDLRLDDLPRLDGVRVLVVDDDAETCQLLRDTLEERGAAVTTVRTAGEARTALDRGKLDVLVSDIRLPDSDGYALVRGLRAEAHGLPAVAVTAYSTEEDRGRALAAGYQVYLAKPFAPRDLVTAIAELTCGSMTN